MALISRLTHLMRADFHAVLDRVEEPELMLRQAVRDMEQELTHAQSRIERLTTQTEQLTARSESLTHALDDISGELDLCFETGNESLARHLVKKKLTTSQLIQAVQQKRADTDRKLAREQKTLAENRLRFESMRQKAEVLAAEERNCNDADIPFDEPGVIRDEDVEIAFLREKQQRAAS